MSPVFICLSKVLTFQLNDKIVFWILNSLVVCFSVIMPFIVQEMHLFEKDLLE